MKKGYVFTMDAAFALVLSVMMIVTVVNLLEMQSQSNEDIYYLSRIARDKYEIEFYGGTVNKPWINTQCNTAPTIGVERAIVYDEASNSLAFRETKVCINA